VRVHVSAYISYMSYISYIFCFTLLEYFAFLMVTNIPVVNVITFNAWRVTVFSYGFPWSAWLPAFLWLLWLRKRDES
jgi:hypothetical protein